MQEQMQNIIDSVTLNKFIDKIHGLHDCLLHELHFYNNGYVDKDGKMFGDCELPNMKIIFQSQFKNVIAFILDIKGITVFKYDPRLEFELDAEYSESGISLYLSGRENQTSSLIIAKEISYQLLDNSFRGQSYKWLENIG